MFWVSAKVGTESGITWNAIGAKEMVVCES